MREAVRSKNVHLIEVPLRQYVKKGTDLILVCDEDIALAQDRINYRPKKCLGFKQLAIIFKDMAQAA